MAINFSKLITPEKVTLQKVRGKKVAVSTHSLLLSSLTSGSPEPNEHIKVILSKISTLLDAKLKPVFVLQGRFPEIRRHQRITNELPPPGTTNIISPRIIEEVIQTLTLLGFPIVQAPSEEDAQAAHLAQKEEVWAVVSQSTDSLLYGSPRVITNFAQAKPASPKKDAEFKGASLVDSKEVLSQLSIDPDQMIVLAMLLGTRFNPAIVGLTSQQALHLVRKWKDFGKLFKYAGWNYAYTWKEVYDCIKTLPVTNRYKLKWVKPRPEQVTSYFISRGIQPKKISDILAKIP